jgi:hypothetical protein
MVAIPSSHSNISTEEVTGFPEVNEYFTFSASAADSDMEKFRVGQKCGLVSQ